MLISSSYNVSKLVRFLGLSVVVEVVVLVVAAAAAAAAVVE